jgi:hypothetical protein
VGDKDPITKEFCDKRCVDIDDKITKIDKLFNGNGNIEDGIRYQIKILWLDYMQRKKTTMGWMDWMYRTIIGGMLIWVSGAAVWLIQNMG